MISKVHSPLESRNRLGGWRFLIGALWLAAMLPVLVTAGCEQSETKFEPRELEGKIDSALPEPLQAKQAVVARWLRGMQQGIGELAGLRLLVPGVEMKESFDQFYNQHKRLVRWEFGSNAQGNQIPVVLYFDERESGVFDESQLKPEERRYSVTASGNRWIIGRVAN